MMKLFQPPNTAPAVQAGNLCNSDWVSCIISSEDGNAIHETETLHQRRGRGLTLTSSSPRHLQADRASGSCIVDPPKPSSRPVQETELRIARTIRSQISTSTFLSHSTTNADFAFQIVGQPLDSHNGRKKSPDIYLVPPTSLTDTRIEAQAWLAPSTMDPNNLTQTPNVSQLLKGLGGNDDPVRKMAAFKLQTLINDPSFAEHFVQQGGLPKLRLLVLESTGNTLAYGLASFARLLDVDQGWEAVDTAVVEKVVELVVCQPLVNILRGAMAILVGIVSRPYHAERSPVPDSKPQIGGFQALKPAISLYPQFLEMLVSRLSSADHALCANALQLINSLMRDAITNDNETEWPKFIKRIQDLGVIKAVYVLMKGSALQDLAHPLLEFQALTKVLLRRWRDVPVDLVKPEHRRTIKAIHLSSNPERRSDVESKDGAPKPKHNPYKWRRLGFSTETPEPDFTDMGFLGMMDLSDYVRKHQDEFQHILMEHAVSPENKRCPIARASLTVTAILFEHFEVEKMEQEDSKSYLALESRTNFERIFKPLLLHWARLHVAGLHAYLRLWKATGAELGDFSKIHDLVRILIENLVGGADRTKSIEEIETELASYEYSKLRELQMELLDLTYEDVWGSHLSGVREELQSEALQFVKEQRIRCLLAGAWFPLESGNHDQEHGGPVKESSFGTAATSQYRFIKLSEDRNFLHWGDYDEHEDHQPPIASLKDRIDVSIISSVVSNVTTNDKSSIASDTTLRDLQQDKFTTTKITIHGYMPMSRGAPSRTKSHARTGSKASSRAQQQEMVLLTFQPPNHILASEWVDGLLMLLNQQPITAETNKLITTMSDYGLKVRLLNVRFNDEDGMIGGMDGADAPEIPSREGLDEDYYYQI